MSKRLQNIVLLLGFAAIAHADSLPDNAASANQARESLGQKILKTSQQLDMKEISNTDSYSSAAGELDPDSGNSRLSNTTYHSYVWDYCEQWVGSMFCEKWRDPYISGHGLEGGDFSPLEGLIGQEWKQRRNIDSGEQYAIWQIKRDGDARQSNRDGDGKLDRRDIVDMRLLPTVQKKVQDLGDQTAVRTIASTYDKDSGSGKNVLPNMEVLRLMSARWTKMYRNRLVSNLGQLRTSDKPIEFATGEDKPDCEAYLRATQTEGEELGMEERIQSQARLDPETRAEDLRRRFRLCTQMRQASVYDVNPTAQGDQVGPGDPETEQFDKWRTRLNIGTIDYAGINPNELPKPSKVKLRKRDYSSLITEHEVGGIRVKAKKWMTNAEQLRSYNRNLDEAAVGWKEVAMRSSNIVDRSKDVQKEKVRIGASGPSLVRLNGLTQEMRGELKKTTAAQRMPAMSLTPAADKSAEVAPEMTPAELSITKK